MAHNPELQARLRLSVAVVGFVVALAAMIFYLRNGGARMPGAPRPDVEECGVVLAGSSTIGLRLAPALVEDFLKQGGYRLVPRKQTAEGAVLVVGRRDNLICSVRIHSSEPSEGFRHAVAGKADIVMSTRPVLPQDLEGLPAGESAASAFSEQLIAYDAMAVVVHATNPLRQISLDQAGFVALGAASNWADVGGAASPIRLYASLENAGPDDLPNDLVPSKDVKWATARDRPSATVLRDDPSVLEKLAADPLGVGFLSAAYPRDPAQLRDLSVQAGAAPASPSADAVRAQAYPLARRLFLYVRADAQERRFAREFVTYAASSAAFDRIDELGYVAIRPADAAATLNVRALGCRIGVPESATLAAALTGARREGTILRFREGTVELDAPARADVRRLSGALTAQIARGDQVLLVGHSDIDGVVERNRTLALERALAARAAFEAQGVYGLQVESAGEVCPLEDSETEAGKRANRRVEIWVRPAAR